MAVTLLALVGLYRPTSCPKLANIPARASLRKWNLAPITALGKMHGKLAPTVATIERQEFTHKRIVVTLFTFLHLPSASVVSPQPMDEFEGVTRNGGPRNYSA
jgi:hypothetical protein